MELLILCVLVIIAFFIVILYFRIDRYLNEQNVLDLERIQRAYPSPYKISDREDDSIFLSRENKLKRNERIRKVLKRMLKRI